MSERTVGKQGTAMLEAFKMWCYGKINIKLVYRLRNKQGLFRVEKLEV